MNGNTVTVKSTVYQGRRSISGRIGSSMTV